MNDTEVVNQRALFGRPGGPLGRVLAGLASIAVVAFGVVAPLGVAAAHTNVANRDLILPRTPAAASAARLQAAACKGVTLSVSFQQARLVEGKKARLEIAISNCTSKPFNGSLTTFGIVCVVVDPISVPVKLPSGSAQASIQTYAVTSCTGKAHITARLQVKGKVIATKTAYLTIVAKTG